MQYVIRVSLPDRPGSLHDLTCVFADAGADIVSLDVIERAYGHAIDDLCITGLDDPETLRKAVDELPATVVMSLREVASFRDRDGPLALSAMLVGEGPGAVRLLVERLPEALWSTWAVAVAQGWLGVEVLAASSDAPVPTEASWLPLPGARRLTTQEIALPGWPQHSEIEVAAAPLGQATSAVMIGRVAGPRFLDRELRQLDLLSTVAVATEVAHSKRRPLTRIEPVQRAPTHP